MVTKLNSYVLPENVVEKMRAKIIETKEKNIELGFGLCRLKFINTLRTGNECTGDECSMEQVPECSTGLYVGGYHTHPRGPANPSITDLRGAYVNDVECIGSVKENAIRCFVRIGPRVPMYEKDIVAAVKDIEEPLVGAVSKEKYQKWEKARNEILNKHFKAIDIE
jgi:hypothetical protein